MIDPGVNGRTVLVTGGAVNIGAAISRAFAAQGAKVAVHHVAGTTTSASRAASQGNVPAGSHDAGAILHDTSALLHDVDDFVASLPHAISVEADFLEPGAARRVFDHVEEHLGPVDILVNNAAHAASADTFDDLDEESVGRTFRINATVPTMLIAELHRRTPATAATGSKCIVNISTDAARGFPGQVAYGASKGALESLTRGAALDLGPTIRVNGIAPGPVQTGWMDDDTVDAVEPTIPLGRVGDPSDIADAVVFLCSHQARWITGQVIQVAGGHWL